MRLAPSVGEVVSAVSSPGDNIPSDHSRDSLTALLLALLQPGGLVVNCSVNP